ncbi:MAG TPA: hypothetical protein VFE03_01920 [Caulobacteraceae bacterium]|jgi:hypothetical protein|nr:hypothetical protein [Caulobacteraceae bacterium]
MNLKDFFLLFPAPPVSSAAIRAEIFFLGGRHRGEPLLGAIEELKAPGLERDRMKLLEAVIRHLRPGGGPMTSLAGAG